MPVTLGFNVHCGWKQIEMSCKQIEVSKTESAKHSYILTDIGT